MHNSVQGVQGSVQGSVQGKCRVFIGLCRVCRAFAPARARNARNIIVSTLYTPLTRARANTPAHPAHPAHALFCAAHSRAGVARTPAHLLLPLHINKKRLSNG